jgi:dienelactone hydrolase
MGDRTTPLDREVEIQVGERLLPGRLRIPADAPGIVVFAHGSGSSRHSPRNQAVAAHLDSAGIGTLLVDLLTETEGGDRALVFDIPLLARRLAGIAAWLRRQEETRSMRLGYFGASTGAAAALTAAAVDPAVHAVVSRGGRPDLAGQHLGEVTAPTLLIVCGADDVVLDLNRTAQRRLRCVNDLAVVAGATHLFEEPGTLEEVARLAAAWFREHLGTAEHQPSD